MPSQRHTRPSRVSRVFLVAALVLLPPVAAAGCGCPTALLPGVLVSDGEDLAIREDTGGFVRPVRWPFGYGTRRDSGGLALTDLFGKVKAREGDHVRLPGGEISSDGPWGVCGELEVSP